MIIQCDQCKTRFRLADEKIDAKGVRVRCTKCQHTFIVRQSIEMAVAAAKLAEAKAASSQPAPPAAPSAQGPSPSLDDMFGAPQAASPSASAAPSLGSTQAYSMDQLRPGASKEAGARRPEKSPTRASEEEMDAALSALDFGAGLDAGGYDPPLPSGGELAASAPPEPPPQRASGSDSMDDVFGFAPSSPSASPQAALADPASNLDLDAVFGAAATPSQSEADPFASQQTEDFGFGPGAGDPASPAGDPAGLDLDSVFGAPGVGGLGAEQTSQAPAEPPGAAPDTGGGWDFDFSDPVAMAAGASGPDRGAAAAPPPADDSFFGQEASLGEGMAAADSEVTRAAEGALSADPDPFGAGFDLGPPPAGGELGLSADSDPFASLDLAGSQGEAQGPDPYLGGDDFSLGDSEGVFDPSGQAAALGGEEGFGFGEAAAPMGGSPAMGLGRSPAALEGAAPLTASATGALVPAPQQKDLVLSTAKEKRGGGVLIATMINGLFLAVLLLVVLGGVVAARTPGPLDASVLSPERIRSAFGQRPDAATVLSTIPGRYKTLDGNTIVYVRGEVMNGGSSELARPKLTVRMMSAEGTLLASSEGVAGAKAKPEDLFRVTGAVELKALMDRLEREAPAKLAPKGSLPYVAIFLSVSADPKEGNRFEAKLVGPE